MNPFIEQYNKHFTSPPKNILEIGSRDGDDADLLKHHFNIPDDKVFIVEPHPHCIDHIKEKYPNYKIYEYAISLENGVSKFNAIFTSNLGVLGMSSLLDRTYHNGYENWIDVNTITGKDLCDMIGEDEYDLVKIDVEGYSYEALKSFGDSIRKIKMMHVEVEHYKFWKNQKLYKDIVDLLTPLGFEECYRFDYVYTPEQIQSDIIWKRI
jgi:FkbM family methyltransferase